MNKEKLAQHLYNKLWQVSKSVINDAIDSYEEVEQWKPKENEIINYSDDGEKWDTGKFVKFRPEENKTYPYLIEANNGYSWTAKHIRPLQIQPTKRSLDIKPIIHVQQRNTLEERVKIIEQHLKL